MSWEKDIRSEEQKYGPKGNKGKPKGSICVSVSISWVLGICIIGSSGDFGFILVLGWVWEVVRESLDDWEGVQVLLDGLSVEVGLSDREVREEWV